MDLGDHGLAKLQAIKLELYSNRAEHRARLLLLRTCVVRLAIRMFFARQLQRPA